MLLPASSDIYHSFLPSYTSYTRLRRVQPLCILLPSALSADAMLFISCNMYLGTYLLGIHGGGAGRIP